VAPDADTAESESEQTGRLALGRRLIANALRYTPAPVADTARLRQFRHDADLLPRLQVQLQRVLEGFHRDSNVVYDIQGRNDNGCDLLVRLTTSHDCQFIGFQVKSHRELLTEDAVNLLIRQHFDAKQRYAPLLKFYIFLAADLSEAGPQHRVIRAIQQRFSTEANVVIISPQYAESFLRLSNTAIDALITQTMRTGDPLTEAARSDLRRHPVAAAVLLRLVERRLSGHPTVSRESIMADTWIQAVAEVTPNKRLRNSPFGRSIDGRFTSENEYREHFGLPGSSDDELADYNEGRPDDDEYEEILDDFLEDMSDSLFRQMLLPNEREGPDSPGRLLQYLPDVLDMLDEEVEFTSHEQEEWFIRIEEQLPLVAITSEGIIKHELEGDEVISYVVNVLFPAG
jgi:hypothetical protein